MGSGGLSPNSAVPVFAITGPPGTSASSRPLPRSTTPRIIVRSCRASAAVSGFAGVFCSTFWSGSRRGSTADPSSTEATTVAIAIGEASTVPWPIIPAAFWVSLSAGSTLPKNAGKTGVVVDPEAQGGSGGRQRVRP